MEFVKRVLGSSKRLYPENSGGSGSYGRRLSTSKKKKKKAPQGCICVYVGAERERFVIKVKIANHPLFKALLDAAEREYGYRNNGPLWLPCDVDLFSEALKDMENSIQGEEETGSVGCAAFAAGHSFRRSPSSASNNYISCRYLLTGSVIHHYQTLVSWD